MVKAARRTDDLAERIAAQCSLDKQFTAAAILILEQRGELKTSDLISKHIDGVPIDTLFQNIWDSNRAKANAKTERSSEPLRGGFFRGMLGCSVETVCFPLSWSHRRCSIVSRQKR